MTRRMLTVAALASLLTVSVSGCLKPGDQSYGPLPAGQSMQYAVEYPRELRSLVDRFNNERLAAEYAIENLEAFPDTLQEPDWGKVLFVVDQAVEDGRSKAFAQRMEELDTIARFVDAHGEQLQGADVAFKQALQVHRTSTLEAQSDALQTIGYFSEGLGAYNASVLREQVLSIVFAAYVVQVELVELQGEVAEALAQDADVRQTLQRAKAELDEMEQMPDLTDTQRSILAIRRQGLESALAEIDGSTQTAHETLKGARDQIRATGMAFNTAVVALRADLQQRAVAAAGVDVDAPAD